MRTRSESVRVTSARSSCRTNHVPDGTEKRKKPTLPSAIVVGSGPNGLAAAITLARAGLDVTAIEGGRHPGGGTRSGEMTAMGVLHDDCSGIHPLAVDNPFMRETSTFRGLAWNGHGQKFSTPTRSMAATVPTWSARCTRPPRGLDLMSGATGGCSSLSPESSGTLPMSSSAPGLHVPRSPLRLARFGSYASLPASIHARHWRGQRARALWAGAAAHAFRPFHTLASSADRHCPRCCRPPLRLASSGRWLPDDQSSDAGSVARTRGPCGNRSPCPGHRRAASFRPAAAGATAAGHARAVLLRRPRRIFVLRCHGAGRRRARHVWISGRTCSAAIRHR